MPIIFGAIVPHPPIIIPSIGRQNLRYVRKTKKALEQLAGELYQTKPDSIIVISPHGELLDKSFTINQAPTLKADFQQFGDFETVLEFSNDLGLGYQIKESLETKLPVALINQPQLDYGSAVPLFYLLKNLKKVPIIPISYANLDRKINFEFGQQIRQLLESVNKRVAVIASADLSHSLTKKAPAGYSPRGKEFDGKIVELLEQKKIYELLNLDEQLIKEANECGYRPLMILLGIFSELNYQVKILSYESSLGVGHLVGQLVIG